MKRINNAFNRVLAFAISMYASQTFAAANNTVDIGTTSDKSPLQKVVSFMQEFVNFIGGPGAAFVVFISAVCCVALWVAAPKQSSVVMGWLLRVVTGGILIFNITMVFSWLKAY
ncbi:hypothetical protein WH50_06400 [Pokkaliibacter plantistimulans]|uniref:Conjugal transfer protein TrbC n=1 Tax=Pokkaliibacter plantistimulans TaxID=1635171 RepID=A0ABX5M591_9GAMM|nr:hypothetical protein [Pokkaliibacter plantistimulans]PXF32085.1 hypothetical protein WH50_06400 [Pokkaliibacter plantistimulans]